jgi:hypothetical protein
MSSRPNQQAKSISEKTAKEILAEKKKWQSEGRKEFIEYEAAAVKDLVRAELVESRLKSEQIRAVNESVLASTTFTSLIHLMCTAFEGKRNR